MSLNVKVGEVIKINPSAKCYATGQVIPDSIKDKKFTVMQVSGDKVLLKEIYSWVFIKDIIKTINPPVYQAPKSKIEYLNKTGVLNISNIYGVTVKVSIVTPSGKKNVRTLTPLKQPYYLVIHNTGNPASGAGDESHAKYLQSVENADTTYVSWHFTVDEDSITQHLPIYEKGFHAGDGNGTGNSNGIGIEIAECGNYAKCEENAIKLINFLMSLESIPKERVRPHRAFMKKLCPRKILKSEQTWEADWGKFINRVVDAKLKLDDLKK